VKNCVIGKNTKVVWLNHYDPVCCICSGAAVVNITVLMLMDYWLLSTTC